MSEQVDRIKFEWLRAPSHFVRGFTVEAHGWHVSFIPTVSPSMFWRVMADRRHDSGCGYIGAELNPTGFRVTHYKPTGGEVLFKLLFRLPIKPVLMFFHERACVGRGWK